MYILYNMKSFNPKTDETEMRKFGAIHENKEHEKLNEIFGLLKKHKERFSIFDFSNEKYIVELKTRTNKYDEYPTTAVSMNKIDYEDNRAKVFIFKFTDGIYRWNNDTEYETGLLFDKPHAFIDINNLIKI